MTRIRVPSKLHPEIDLAAVKSPTQGLDLPFATKGMGPLAGRYVQYRPSQVKCPECDGPASIVIGAEAKAGGEYRTHQYVCTQCGLEFYPRGPPVKYIPETKQEAVEQSRKKAEEAVFGSLKPGVKYDLQTLQASVGSLMENYYVPPEKQGAGADRHAHRGPMFEGRGAENEWKWKIPFFYEDGAKAIFAELRDSGYDVEAALVTETRPGGVEFKFFEIIAKRVPGVSLAGADTAAKYGAEVVTVPESRFCIACYATYPAGTKVLRKVVGKPPKMEYICASCGNPLRRPYEQLGGKIERRVYMPRPAPKPERKIVVETPVPFRKTNVPKSIPGIVGMVTPPMAGQPDSKLATLDFNGKCTRCGKDHKQGDHVIRIGGFPLCPTCGGLVRRT